MIKEMNTSLSLFEVQKKITTAIKSNSLPVELNSMIKNKPPISLEQRLEIYQNAYRIRIIESLRDDFYRVEEKLGKDDFENKAWSFILSFPSKYASLAEVSRQFPHYMKTFSDELYELASIDWIEILSNYARNADSKDKLSHQEVQQGVNFNLKINPTLRSFKGKENVFVSCQQDDEIIICSLSFLEYEFLESLSQPISLNDLSIKLTEMKLEDDSIQNKLIEWIKFEIVLCVPTTAP